MQHSGLKKRKKSVFKSIRNAEMARERSVTKGDHQFFTDQSCSGEISDLVLNVPETMYSS